MAGVHSLPACQVTQVGQRESPRLFSLKFYPMQRMKSLINSSTLQGIVFSWPMTGYSELFMIFFLQESDHHARFGINTYFFLQISQQESTFI